MVVVPATAPTGWVHSARNIVLAGDCVPMAFGASRDGSAGAAAPPSLRMTRAGVFRFLWPVKAGARRVSVKVRQPYPATPRPRLVVKTNAEVGLLADATADAASGSDWLTVGPITFTATAAGTVWVELWCRAPGTQVECSWDDISVQ